MQSQARIVSCGGTERRAGLHAPCRSDVGFIREIDNSISRGAAAIVEFASVAGALQCLMPLYENCLRPLFLPLTGASGQQSLDVTLSKAFVLRRARRARRVP